MGKTPEALENLHGDALRPTGCNLTTGCEQPPNAHKTDGAPIRSEEKCQLGGDPSAEGLGCTPSPLPPLFSEALFNNQQQRRPKTTERPRHHRDGNYCTARLAGWFGPA